MLFHKCPICGEFAFIQPDLSTEEYKVFRCNNGHTFKKKISHEPKDWEVWRGLPEWARLLKDIFSGQ